jgi:uncharacterized membrane protein YfcA
VTRGASLLVGLIALAACCPDALAAGAPGGASAWWIWPVALFLLCFVLGIVAVPAGIGGGVLFVPIVAGFFPFHLDFVRAAGLLVAMAGAVAAGPRLIENGLADLRLALAPALIASVGSIGGALLGTALPVSVVQISLGFSILAIFVVMAAVKPADRPADSRRDAIAVALGLHGTFRDKGNGHAVEWHARNTPIGLAAFMLIGVVAGMFGLGAGWGNVPVLNLVMGIPLKLSAGTSGLIMAFANSSAAWIFLREGAVLPLVAVPSIIGMMLGARIGSRLLDVMKAAHVRALVLALLFLAGSRMVAKGLGW